MESWREELYHHGINGQKWGQRNGPPYPLDYSDHSSAEKKHNPKKLISGVASKVTKNAPKAAKTLSKGISKAAEVGEKGISNAAEKIQDKIKEETISKQDFANELTKSGFKKQNSKYGDYYEKHQPVIDSDGNKTSLLISINLDDFGNNHNVPKDKITNLKKDVNDVVNNFSAYDAKFKKEVTNYFADNASYKSPERDLGYPSVWHFNDWGFEMGRWLESGPYDGHLMSSEYYKHAKKFSYASMNG